MTFDSFEIGVFFYSAEMLVNLGIPWVIIGHSERRSLLNESSEVTRLLHK